MSCAVLASAQCTAYNEPGLSCLGGKLISGADLSSGGLYCGFLPEENVVLDLTPFCNGVVGTSENTAFYHFFSNTNNLRFLIAPVYCDTIELPSGTFTGIQASIFKACEYTNSINCVAACQNGPFELGSAEMPVGELMVLAVDGCNGAVCEFSIELLEGELLDVDPTSTPGLIGTAEVCENESSVFLIENLPESGTVNWNLSPSIAASFSSGGSIVEISYWGNLSSYELCPTFQSAPSGPVMDTCLTISVLPSPEISSISADAALCEGDELALSFEADDFDTIEWTITNGTLSCSSCASPVYTMGATDAVVVLNLTNNGTGCSESLEIQMNLNEPLDCLNAVGVEHDWDLLSIFPNPANEIVRIQSNEKMNSVHIYNWQGIRIYEGAESEIGVSTFPAGVYMMEVEFASGKKGRSTWVKL